MSTERDRLDTLVDDALWLGPLLAVEPETCWSWCVVHNQADSCLEPATRDRLPVPHLDQQPIDLSDLCARLQYLPVILTTSPLGWALGVTAYGQDFTWALVESYMRLGYLPPFALIEQGLPDRPHGQPSRVDLWLVAGARRTTQLVQEAGRHAEQALRATRQDLLTGRKSRYRGRRAS